jgi:DNA polymerase gamma 1
VRRWLLQYLTSRVNWVVQSSAVDFLHLMLVSMEDFIQRYGLAVRRLRCGSQVLIA